jgi:hypothetical protein
MNWPEQKVVVRLIAQHATKIRKAFKSALDGDAIAKAWAETHPTSDAPQTTTSQMARDWALAHAVTNNKQMVLALGNMYADAYTLGVKVAKIRLNGLQKDATPTVGIVDWSTWKPGLPAAAALVKPTGGLRGLLDSRRILADDVLHTKLDRIGTALAKGLEQGLTPKETSRMINEIIDDPQQALLIAQTETSRAVSIAARDEYETAQVEQVEWLVAEGCEECQDNADASPIGIDETFPSGDSEPPAHPNCMCALAPYFSDTAPTPDTNVAEDYSNLDPVVDTPDVINTMNQQRDAGYLASEAQVNSIADYMSGSGMYSTVNTYLREGAWGRYTPVREQVQAQQVINHLDEVITQAPKLAKDTLTYRGIWGQKETAFFTGLKPGDTFTDSAFVSTSLNEQIAKNFARYDKANGGVILEIVNPKGTTGVFPIAQRVTVTEKQVAVNSENEWLLPRNTKFEVISVDGRRVKVKVSE